MNRIINDLFKLKDQKYCDFQTKLFPTLNANMIIGVRTPELKRYAKKMLNDNTYLTFLKDLPHKYFDENQLHAFIISEFKDYDKCILFVNNFLPFIDNWATCDQLLPKVFKTNHDKLIKQVKLWLKSREPYTIRFGIGVLMRHFLDNDFKVEYLELVANIKSEEYYVNMMRAWYFATALVKQYEASIAFLERHKLDTWTHNKAIQKAIESFRITDNQKEYLKSLKDK